MTILVVGNGFDLAHHLPTQYSDFLVFVKAFKGTNNKYSSFIGEMKKSKKDLYAEMQTLIGTNALIEFFLSIYEERCKEGKFMLC